MILSTHARRFATMRTLLYRLQHLLIVATSMALVILGWLWQPWLGGLLLVAVTAGLWFGTTRGLFTLPVDPGPRADGPAGVQQARAVVTHLLKELTRVQVAYLCQDIGSPSQGRAWLKRALPRAFMPSLDELLGSLEAARGGEAVPSLRLAQRIMARRGELVQLEEALERSVAQHPGYCVAHPLIFVVTEDLDENEQSEPGLVTLAGWNPGEPTLLPRVDRVTLYADLEAGKTIRGQTDLERLLSCYPDRVQCLDEPGGVYAVQPLHDTARLSLRLDHVPLGFTIGGEEFTRATSR